MFGSKERGVVGLDEVVVVVIVSTAIFREGGVEVRFKTNNLKIKQIWNERFSQQGCSGEFSS